MNGISFGLHTTNPAAITAPRGGLVGRITHNKPAGRIVMYNHHHQWRRISCSEHPQAAEGGPMGGFSQQEVSSSGCQEEGDDEKGKVADILAKLVARCRHQMRFFSLFVQMEGKNRSLYEPLQPKEANEEDVTPMAIAGTLSKSTFWWLNPLLIKGKGKVLDSKDIPKLRHEDRAEACYLDFIEKMEKQKEKNISPSMLFIWQQKELMITGFFALVKVLSLVSGPLVLRAFIRFFQGKQSFDHQGYFLILGLFLVKFLESVSQRQLNFRSRLIGLRVKSMLCAAIYQKQLRLSNDAKLKYSPGEIMNYASVDATRIGEIPLWFHQIWMIGLQICLAMFVMYLSVGVATFAALVVVIFTVVVSKPLGKWQHKILKELMATQDKRSKAITEAIANMKVLKLYTWETHFRDAVEKLRNEEMRWLSAFIFQKCLNMMIFWSSPAIVVLVTFYTCYLRGTLLDASDVFTFLATIGIIQEPIRLIADVYNVFIEASVALTRILKFLEAPELQKEQKHHVNIEQGSAIIKTEMISWNDDSSKPTLTHVNLDILTGEKVAICGEVGSGKSTLISAVLGEVPNIKGTVQVNGKLAYVSQTAWIQTVTVRDNILFGSLMDDEKYQEVVTRCSLVKDIEMFPFGDQTIIGERGVNLSGGQKQRIQLARALYQDADIYLLDDPFSAVDAHTAASLFKEYIMEALSNKTVLLVTHQVDFLPAFDKILLMADGKVVKTGTYSQLLDLCEEFRSLVIALGDTSGSDNQSANGSKFYYASAKELMRLDGTSKSLVASHLAQSIAGTVTIRAFANEDRFLLEHLHLIDGNASTLFHSFSANEWLIQRLEILCAVAVSSSALAITLLPFKASDSGLIGMALSYGLSLSSFLVNSVQSQCQLSNMIVSVERLDQYMHIISEAPEIIEANRPSGKWPSIGRVVVENLKIRYQPNSPLVLQGISCIFEGGHKIGIVGRTGSGKTTLISALFRLVEPTEGRIVIDGVDITSIGLHDLRSRFGIIPQEPTLFSGSVRYNLDPLGEHSDNELWTVLKKCQLQEAIQDKKEGLDSLVVQDGSNWSLGQRQLFCLARALLKRRKILVLDEATASVDNATDAIIQKTIREEFSERTVITVAHRIPTVIDCTMVLVMQDGKVMEFDTPAKLMNEPTSLFAQLINEYRSQHKTM